MKDKCFARKDMYEVSVVNILVYILMKWRLLLIWAVVMAIVVGGAKFVVDRNALRAESESDEILSEEGNISLEELEAQLTDKQKVALKEAKNVQKQLLEKQSYQKESILMSIDPYEKREVRLLYYVDAGYVIDLDDQIYPDMTEEIADAYISYITRKGIQDALVSRLDWGVEAKYVCELVDSARADEESNLLVVYVTGQDNERANELADHVAELLKAYNATLIEKFEEHELVEIGRYNNYVIDSSLATQQYNLENTIITLQKSLNNITVDFNEAQLRLLEGDKAQQVVAQVEGSQMVQEATETLPSVNIKFVVLGAAAGIIICCGWLALRYVLCSKIRSFQEIQDSCELRVLGVLTLKNASTKKLDGWLSRLLGREQRTLEEQKDILLSNIKITCRKAGIDKVFITSSLHLSEEERNLIDELMSELNEAGVEAIYGEDVRHNALSLEQMAEIENVVIVEKEGASRYVALEKEILLCEDKQAEVLGVIGLN